MFQNPFDGLGKKKKTPSTATAPKCFKTLLPVASHFYILMKTTHVMKQLIPLYFLFLVTACGNSEAETAPTDGSDAAYYPVVAYLQEQTARIDSSLYTLIQVNKSSGHTDTIYLERKDFKTLSQPFTNLPNIATGKLRGKYNESRLYDETLDRFIITYTPKPGAEDLEVLRQDIVIVPNTGEGENIESVYIERQLEAGDSTVQMKMSWEVDNGFTIRSIIQKDAAPERLQNLEVLWLNPRSAAKL
jgi:hypothetical protein